MEPRKITVVSTKTQKKSVIMSGAETLGELKNDLAAAGIDYSNMTFYEGVSKSELKHDDSVLPKDVPYTNRRTGETRNTNELVFMLTNMDKKIASGSISRAEIYNEIRNLGLQQEIASVYGKHYTNCTNAELLAVLDEAHNSRQAVEEEEECFPTCNVGAAVAYIAATLHQEGLLSAKEYNNVLYFLGEGPEKAPYSDEEIEDMLEDCNY